MSSLALLREGAATYGRKLGEGVAWWLDELQAMARLSLGRSKRRKGELIAERLEDGGYRLSKPGRADRVHRPGDRAIQAALMLPPGLALTRVLWRPPLPERDLLRMTELDLDRLTPFAPESVYAVIEVLKPTDPQGRRQIHVAVAPRREVEDIVAKAIQDGVRPKALLARDGLGLIDQGLIDFLPKMRRQSSLVSRRLRLARLTGWALAAALLALNLGVAVWRDVQATQALQDQVSAQAPLMARIKAARGELEQLRFESSHQTGARVKSDPLRVLAALSRSLPAQATVERFAWDGAAARVAGQTQEGVDVGAALRRDPLFADARAADGEQPSSGTHFDIVLTVSPGTGSPKR
jgi:hypothetical protein